MHECEVNLFELVTAQSEVSLPDQKPKPSKSDHPTEAAHCFTFAEIEDATKEFEKKIGSGGFGVVYYGKTRDGKEIAVKVLTSNSYQGKREFSNEVNFSLIELYLPKPFLED